MGACKMRYSLNHLMPMMALVLLCGIAVLAQTPTYNLGRTPSQAELQAWDIAIGPAGKELPSGSGTAKEGAKIYVQRCAQCHGPTATEGKFLHGPLVGGIGTLNTSHPLRTVGSFFPFATTVWDYINRAMPKNAEGSLKPDEVYAVTAFLLYRNGIIQESDLLDAQSLPKVQMPNRDGFVPPRPEYKPGEKRPFGFYP